MKGFKIQKTYFLFILAAAVFLISGCGGGSSGGGGGGSTGNQDTTAPTVSSTIAAAGAVDVAKNGSIAATFSEAMDPLTITAATFTLTDGIAPVPSGVTYMGTVAILNPTGNLADSTTYTATITIGAKDRAGNALASNYIWSFTTGTATDSTAPMVSSIIPADLSTGMAINGNINATFSEGMNPLTITTATFTLTRGAIPVSGVVTYVGTVATFNPTGNLAANTLYTATITTGAEDLSGNALAGNYIWSFFTGAVTDTTAPTVSSTIPAALAVGVAINQNINAFFSEGMDPLTITTATFTLKQGVTPVLGTVTYVGTVATFNPTSPLAVDTLYTATIATGAKDLAGNALAAAKTWSFTTGVAADSTPPIVTLTIPADTAISVAINGNISATFSEGMDPLTLTTATFTLAQGGLPVPCTVMYVGTVVILNPISDLFASTTYDATITTNAKDLAGNALAVNKTWSFTTGLGSDITEPSVTLTDPASGATNVALSKKIYATFSEAMDPLTINTATFTLMQGATPVPGAVTYVGLVATFTPTGNLALNTTYTATITTGAKDLANNALAFDETWSFTTVTAIGHGPAPVDLGTAGNFVILSKAGLTSVPTSAITGNIGTSPITGAAIVGLSCAEVTGTIYTVDAAGPACSVVDPVGLTTAISNMETAYTDAAGRSTPDFTELGAGNISGLILVPGLYKWGTGVLIATDVTLNGGPNDVWIFQIAGDLTVDPGAKVLLAGGALPKNIFWQCFGAVALDTTTHLEGIVLSQTAITLATGATVNGRLLSQTAVTLDQSTVVQPAP